MARNHYEVLGVSPGATADEIRKAYIVRSKLLHPDRFNQVEQKDEWELANEMVKELNQAYSILKDSASRTEYHKSRSTTATPDNAKADPRQTNTTPPPSTPFKAGKVSFSSLPENLKQRLLERVSGRIKDQFSEKQGGIGWNYFWMILLAGWLAVLVTSAQEAKWDDETSTWMLAVSAAAALIQGFNISRIIRWRKSPMESWLLVTPLYIIKTHFDQVRYWPIWDIKDIKATHNYKNGSYQNTSVKMTFPSGKQFFTLRSEVSYIFLLSAFERFDDRIQTAKARQDWAYFVKENDFRDLSVQAAPPGTSRSGAATACAFGVCLALYGGVYVFASNLGTGQEEKPAYAQRNRGPERPLSNYPSSAGYSSPSYSSRDSSSSFPERIPHLPPVSSKPKAPPFAEPELPLPANGETKSYSERSAIAPFEVKASFGSHHLVKVVDIISKEPVLTLFVHSGTSAKIEVPLGTYIVKYASGSKWYGYKHLFGPGTRYSKAEQAFDFERLGDQVNGYTITLYEVLDGNLETEAIGQDEF